ncbi:MAG: hypothetical protein H6806_09545, partial [Planctomycetes bacterium]|nr:hypothetical protein [Planctomycetota bacterium]
MSASTPPDPSGSPSEKAADASMDRRVRTDRRRGERRQKDVPVPVERRSGKDRRVAERRKRSINQYDLEAETLEFIRAINRFKERTGRAFPTWSEV